MRRIQNQKKLCSELVKASIDLMRGFLGSVISASNASAKSNNKKTNNSRPALCLSNKGHFFTPTFLFYL